MQNRQRTTIWLALLSVLMLTLAACQPLVLPADMPAADGADASAPAVAEAADEAAVTIPALDDDTPLPPNPSIRMGTLDNGLTYIIRRNAEPEARAELRLAVNAGSLQEDDDQLGLAHFLEHMLFNGTRRFPKQELVDFLESLGVGFGPDLNAYTSFDETVYQLKVPTDDPEILATGLDVLEDWAAYATIDPEEVDAERGVIVEEWRLRDQNASGRIRQQLLPVLFGDSRYTDRQPIGDMEIVRTAPAETLRRYYETYYRPELMAVIAVGDFDVDEVEQMIIERFSALPVPADPVERPAFEVPAHDDTRYLVITDPEYPQTIFQIIRKLPAEAPQSAADYRANMVESLFDTMLNFRLDEIRRQPDAPFTGAFVGGGNLVRPVDTYSVGAQLLDDRILDGVDVVMTEVERVQRFGFTESELERAKAEVLKRYETLYRNRDNTDSAAYVDEYVRHFLTGESIPGIEVEYALVQAALPTITTDEVNAVADNLVGDDNRTLFVITPEKEGLTPPTDAELAAVLAGVADKALEPYEDAVADAELLAEDLAPVDIVDETYNEALDVTEFRLANGVRVIVKPTDFKDDEVLMRAVSPGGSSLVEDPDFPEAGAISSVVDQSGLGEFDLTTLLKLLAGKNVAITPSIDEVSEGLTGSASPTDLETLFQLAYLYMTAPRADADALEVYKTQQISALENRSLNPVSGLQDAVVAARFGDTIRRGPLPVEEIEALDLARAVEIYNDRFGDAGDFTFVFVGNTDAETIKAYAQRYLGNLPAGDRAETFRDVKPDPPTGVIETDVFRGQEEQSIVQIMFPGNIDATPENELLLAMLQDILDVRLTQDLREERGGVYSAYAVADIAEYPDSSYGIFVGFGADPNRIDELTEAVFAIVEDIQANGPSAEDMVKAHEKERRGREEALRTNAFWLSTLSEYGFDPAKDVTSDIEDFATRLDAVTAADIQAAAQEYMPLDRYIQVVLYPESYEGQVD